MKALIQQHIIVKPSIVHGYGVFATKDIPIHTVIEECYSIVTELDDPSLANFYFAYGEKYLILTGFGFIYNHSLTPNASYRFDENKKLLIITSKKHIHANEEIYISYGKNWFQERKISVKKISILQRFFNYLSGVPTRIVVALSGLFIIMYLMNVLTAPKQIQKTLKNLSMTILQEKDT